MRVPEETDLPKIGKHIFNFVMNYASTYRIDNTYNTRMKN